MILICETCSLKIIPPYNRHKSNHNWLTPNFVFQFSILHSQLANAPSRVNVVFLNFVIQRLAVDGEQLRCFGLVAARGAQGIYYALAFGLFVV